MYDNIQNSFKNLIQTTTWMDKSTQEYALKKLSHMQTALGYPYQMANFTILNEKYNKEFSHSIVDAKSIIKDDDDDDDTEGRKANFVKMVFEAKIAAEKFKLNQFKEYVDPKSFTANPFQLKITDVTPVYVRFVFS